VTQTPDFPGYETHVDKAVAADVQSALDATFNAQEGAPLEEVERHLREELADAGVLDDVSDQYVAWAAERIADGAPVIAEVADDA
jgi:hypothetical protein